MIDTINARLAWPDRFFPFFFGVAEKGSGLVYGRYSSWHLRCVNLSRHH